MKRRPIMRQTIHHAPDTRSAYAWCRVDDEISEGDTIIVDHERVVGIAGPHPVAVTELNGAFMRIKAGQDPRDVPWCTPAAIRRAITEAIRRNWPLAEEFKWIS